MCAKYRTLTVIEQQQIVASPSEMQESFNNGQSATMDRSFVQSSTGDVSRDPEVTKQSATMDQSFIQSSVGDVSRDIQITKQNPIRSSSRASSVSTGSSVVTSSGSSEDDQPRMSRMPGKRPRTRSNAGLSDPQRLALIQGIDASHPIPPVPSVPAAYRKETVGQHGTDEVEELENPLKLTRTRTIGRGWTMCSVLPDAHSIDEETANSDKGNESDDEDSLSEDSASRSAVSRTNTLLERVLSDIIHNRPEKLFEDLQEQQSPTSMISDTIAGEIDTTQDSETKLQRKITRLNTFGNSKIEPSEWRDCILDIRKVESINESYENRTMERSLQETTYDSGGLQSANDLEIPKGHETVSRDSVMRAISTASPHASIEWADVQRIHRRITFDEELQGKRRSALSTISGSLSESERTESSATIEVLERKSFRSNRTPIRSSTTIMEVDSDEARAFLGGQQTDTQTRGENLSAPHFAASPSAFSSTSSSSNSSSSVEGKDFNCASPAPLQRSAKEEYQNAREALKHNTILLDRAIDAKPIPRSAAVQTSPIQVEMQRHTYYRPLRRAIQRSSCSKFWSPSTRTSLRVLSQQVPRVVVVPEIKVSEEGQSEAGATKKKVGEEEASEEEDSTSSEDESESESDSESEAETEIIRNLPPPPRTPDDKIIRFYNKPNYRATIYPRQVDEFFSDKTLHQAIQERLLALFLGNPLREQTLRVPLGGGKRTSRIAANFSRRFSQRHLSVAMLMPPPQRPLPAVPVDVSTPNSPRTCDDDLCSDCKAGSPCSVCSGCLDSSCNVEFATSRDDRNTRLSVISLKKKMRRRKTYVLGRDPLHDSWITETESMTSYCSWVSIISGDHSVSSASSCPRRSPTSPMQFGHGLIAGSHRRRSKRKSQLAITDGMLSVPDLLESATHPPSSSILPAHWTGEWMERGGQGAKKSQKKETGLPDVQILSPFSLDPHQYWPDDENATPALEKWKRYKDEQEQIPKAKEGDSFADKVSKRLTMNIHRLSLQSFSSSDTVRMEGFVDSPSSSGSSTVMTPPRAEFLQTGLESPGKRISQILSPYHGEEMVKAVQVAPGRNYVTAIPHLRSSNAPTPVAIAPKHKRWIIIDGNGKRITGGDIRDSGSTWHSNSQDEAYSATNDSFFTSYSSEGANDEGSVPTLSVPNDMRMTQSPESIQQIVPAITLKGPENAVMMTSTRRSVLFSPTSGRPVALEPEQVRSILMKRRSTTDPIESNSNAISRRSNASSSAGMSSSNRSMSIRFADKGGVRKMSSISERVSNTSSTSTTSSRQQSQNLFAPPLPPAIPLPALPQPNAALQPQVRSGPPQPVQPPTAIPNRLKEHGPNQVQQRSQSLPLEARPKAQRSDTFSSSKSGKSSKSRLTRADLSERIQREEVRIKRNDERLSALDKLEGKKQKSHILANLIKSTSNGIAPDSMQTDAGHSHNLTKVMEKARKEEAKRGAGADGQNNQTIPENAEDDEDIATTPLTPFREQLRKMEHEWEVRHHVKEYAPGEAQKFTNVTGFDVGIVPFLEVGSKRDSKDSVGRTKGGIRIIMRGKRSKPTGHLSDIKQSPPAYTADKISVPTIEIKPPTEPFIMDKALERDLHAGLRKLSSVVEARQRAKERCVDK